MITCPSGKVRHASRTAARRFAAGLGFTSGRHRAYLCDDCAGWHLTTGEAVPVAHRPKRPGRGRRGYAQPPPVATREELDAWWLHGRRVDTLQPDARFL